MVGALLAEDAVVGPGGAQALDDEALGGAVHLGDHVGAGGLGVDRGSGAAQTVDEEGGGVGGEAFGEGEEVG